jgi:hypothetical protein
MQIVSTTLTDLITLKVPISFIATLYFFRLSESNTSRCSWFPLIYLHIQTYRMYCSLYPAGLSFYPVNRTSFYSDSFAWQVVAQRSQLFHFALSRGPRVFDRWMTVNVTFLLAVFEVVAEILSFGSQPRFAPNKHVFHCMSDFCWWIFVRFGIGVSETFVRIYMILPVENAFNLCIMQNNS